MQLQQVCEMNSWTQSFKLGYFELKTIFLGLSLSHSLLASRKLAILDYFSSPLRVQNSLVNLNNSTNSLYDIWFNAYSKFLEHALFTDQTLLTLLTQLSG